MRFAVTFVLEEICWGRSVLCLSGGFCLCFSLNFFYVSCQFVLV